MADNPNLNYFKDPTTKLWREPKTDADFTTFKAKQPKAYDTYMKTTGKTAPGTNTGTGDIMNNPVNPANTGNIGNANIPSVQTGYSPSVLSGTGVTSAAGSWDAIDMDNFDSSFDAGMNAYKTAPVGGTPAESGGMFDDWTKTGVGGSKFSNVAAGLGSLAGMYFGYKGIGAAKDALNFQKQQYADQQAQQARANKRQDDFGLALSSAMPAKRVG